MRTLNIAAVSTLLICSIGAYENSAVELTAVDKRDSKADSPNAAKSASKSGSKTTSKSGSKSDSNTGGKPEVMMVIPRTMPKPVVKQLPKPPTPPEAPFEDFRVGHIYLDPQHKDLKSIDDAICRLRRRIVGAPQNPSLKIDLVINMFYAGDYEAAAEQINQVIMLAPRSASAHAILGQIYDYVGEHGDALTNLRQALQLAPDRAELHTLLAASLLRGGNVGESSNE